MNYLCLWNLCLQLFAVLQVIFVCSTAQASTNIHVYIHNVGDSIYNADMTTKPRHILNCRTQFKYLLLLGIESF